MLCKLLLSKKSREVFFKKSKKTNRVCGLASSFISYNICPYLQALKKIKFKEK